MYNIIIYLNKYKYELLLLALVQHLFIGIFLQDLAFYTKVIWPFNMLLLGVASVGVFTEKGKWKKMIKNGLFVIVFLMPILMPFVGNYKYFMLLVSLAYVLFFLFIFIEVIKFLIRPSYINKDIISASACGYLLLIEISAFMMQILFYKNNSSFNGIEISSPAATFIDLVYFCSITLTSIGFGDITPNSHTTKLLTSFFGIIGQFYSVVLVGIIISKFTSTNKK